MTVQRVLPELTQIMPDTDILTVDYSKLTALLIEAVKELDEK